MVSLENPQALQYDIERAMSSQPARRVLIITYYWPPAGGSGVQRWLKFTKYLPEFDIVPVVFVPENPDYPVLDSSLEKDLPHGLEVIRRPIWEPYRVVHALRSIFSSGKRPPANSFVGESSGWMAWVRGNFFIPDPRIFWVRPSVKWLAANLPSMGIDAVITTGPPHSVHLIGLGLKKKFPDLKWFADFRDPWTTWGALEKFRPGMRARRKHAELEQQVMKAADRVITISPFYVRQLERLSGRKIDLIRNGFDEADFLKLEPRHTGEFILRHVGIVHPECDMSLFLEAFRSWAGLPQHKDFVRLVFTGLVPDALRQRVANDEHLRDKVSFEHAVPHRELIDRYAGSSALLMVLSGFRDGQGFLPGKLFEYLATGLPVVSAGPPSGDAAELLLSCGWDAPAEDSQGIIRQLDRAFQFWQSEQKPNVLSTAAMSWSRKSETRKLAQLLSGLS